LEHLWGVLATNSHKLRKKKPPKMDNNLYKPDY
jgi:hypothetical protein